MILQLRRKYARRVATLLLSSTLVNILSPLGALALTSGPSQPEFNSFQPVGTTDMVDKFTGDLTYSLPVLEVPGPQGSSYPLSLSYHSGASPEEEASWVGYGWTLNPGAIVRGTRGFPDDYNNDEVVYWNQVPKNWTATLGTGVGIEAFSFDKDKSKVSIGSLSGQTAIRYNNYSGFGYNIGLGVSLGKGLISLGYQESDGHHSYSARVSPLAILGYVKIGAAKQTSSTEPTKKSKWVDKALKNNLRAMSKSATAALRRASTQNLLGGNRGDFDFDEMNRPTQVTAYEGASYNVSFGVEVNPTLLPIGFTGNLFGSYSYQQNIPLSSQHAYGFMYAGQAARRKETSKQAYDADAISDYYTEKQSSHNKRDVFIGLPFNNADLFSVSGQGMGGVFKIHHDTTGEFGPNRKKSEVKIYNFSAEVSVGPNVGVGLDAGVGKQTLEEASWAELIGTPLEPFSLPSLPNTRQDKINEGTYFKFANDMAADSWQAGISDDAQAAYLTRQNGKYKSVIPSSLKSALGNSTARQSRSSYIGYHTVGQMTASPKIRYCKRPEIIRDGSYVGNDDKIGNKIGEFSIVNESGKRFTYGMPLYCANEKNLQYGVQGAAIGAVSSADGYIIYNGNNTTKVGETRSTAYASTYLLTETVTPDYIDRTLDGPTPDDFGGYTKFYYTKTNLIGSTPYHWRTPYTGNIYQRNSLSDSGDDMGSVAEGDKEIGYLTAVRTKTHTAIFTVSPRQDGFDAVSNESARTTNVQGVNQLMRLDNIKLYSNADIDVAADGTLTPKTGLGHSPIKTVQFRYSYELCKGLPNSKDANTGKLTLTKVWFDYQGVESNLVNPYEFYYQYPTSYAGYTAASSRYTELGTGYNSFTADDQNPTYAPTNVDAWGNYQFQGSTGQAAQRFRDLKTWLNQAPDQTSQAHFDAAAWQLKVIRLPSKAEIHVQYEQDDYAFVQNRGTQALANLSSVVPTTATTPADDGRTNTFYVDPTSIGLTTDAEIVACRDSLINMYVGPDKKDKIYCKFLYSLINSYNLSNATGPSGVNECNSDYISGYVKLNSVDIQAVHDNATNKDWKVLKLVIGTNASDYSLPYQVCEDFVKTQRLGKLAPAGNCDPSASGIPSNSGDAKQIVRQLSQWLVNLPNPNKCAKLNPSFSYFKIPLPKSKKGGGVRVKRLLTYANDVALDNNAVQSNETVLYGTEYIYKLAGSNLSSGVATNEPSATREENPLVRFIPRLAQSDGSKFIAGEDRRQSEGPLGESVLPSSSVGYSRVIEKNIHSGKSNPGFTVTEFFTAREFPVRYNITPLQQQVDFKQSPGLLISSSLNNEYATQGFSVILNNMHGQLKRTASYAGDYADVNSLATSNLVAEQVQEYFTPTAATTAPTLWNAPGQGKDAPAQLPNLPGREVDITMAQHAISDFSNDASAEYDFTVGAFVFPIPFLTMQISINKNESALYTHATTKVVRYPAIVKSVRTMKDGITHLEENLALDRQTGKPVAVRIGDEMGGTYLTESNQASWIYPEKASKAQNEGVVLGQMESSTAPTIATVTRDPLTSALYLTPGTSGTVSCDLPRYVRKGDLVMLNSFGGQSGPYNLYTAAGNDFAYGRLQLFSIPGISQTINNSLSVSGLTVVSSGNTNELAMGASSTTYHKEAGQSPKLDLLNTIGNSSVRNTSFINDFTTAFQVAVGSSAMSGANASTSFSLSPTSPYQHMDVSGFYSRIPDNMRSNLSDASVKKLDFVVAKNGNAIKCVLLSFILVDDVTGATYTVK